MSTFPWRHVTEEQWTSFRASGTRVYNDSSDDAAHRDTFSATTRRPMIMTMLLGQIERIITAPSSSSSTGYASSTGSILMIDRFGIKRTTLNADHFPV